AGARRDARTRRKGPLEHRESRSRRQLPREQLRRRRDARAGRRAGRARARGVARRDRPVRRPGRGAARRLQLRRLPARRGARRPQPRDARRGRLRPPRRPGAGDLQRLPGAHRGRFAPRPARSEPLPRLRVPRRPPPRRARGRALHRQAGRRAGPAAADRPRRGRLPRRRGHPRQARGRGPGRLPLLRRRRERHRGRERQRLGAGHRRRRQRGRERDGHDAAPRARGRAAPRLRGRPADPRLAPRRRGGGGRVSARAAGSSLRERAGEFGLTRAEYDLVVERLGREPNVTEAGVFGALWSEHCGYKNSKPLLRRLPTQGPQVVQGPGENAGVVDLGEGWAVAFKMESHNHPSAVEPVQGAATGVGGILRDIFAMGARPIAVLDSLRFGELTSPRSRHLLAGVVAGIASYGNAVGVPTVGGEVEVNPCYEENPLVNVMAVGLMRRDALRKGTVGEVGNRLYYVGSKTGRDGLGGAVFASADLSAASEADRPAVQVGDPFMEKLLLEACLEAMEEDLVAGVQDMGAAGLSSSVAEMAYRAGQGVDLHLDRVPRREAGMTPLEVMLSESQERMMLTARPGKEEELKALFARYGLDAVEVGVVRDHGELRLVDAGVVVAAMPVRALNEPPTYVREGVEDPAARAARERDLTGLRPVPDPAAALLALLAAPAVASKEPVYRRFDHQVMTNTVVLPGQADAAVLRVKGTALGIAATVDCNSRYVWLDPRLGAAHAVAEAARNLSCVGAEPLGVT